jgi:hypothetical protein
VTTGLIVLAVVVFLLIDGAILFLVFRSRRTAGDYGKIPVPGRTTVALPAGKLKLSYQESYKAGSTTGDDIDFGVPAALQVTVEPPTGDGLDIKGPGFGGMGSSLNTGANWSRALIGTIQIAQPGTYTVTAQGDLPDAIEPQVLIGK